MTGFESQCAFHPKLGAAEEQNWELPKSQSWELNNRQDYTKYVD